MSFFISRQRNDNNPESGLLSIAVQSRVKLEKEQEGEHWIDYQNGDIEDELEDDGGGEDHEAEDEDDGGGEDQEAEDEEFEDVLPLKESVGGKLVSFHLP